MEEKINIDGQEFEINLESWEAERKWHVKRHKEFIRSFGDNMTSDLIINLLHLDDER